MTCVNMISGPGIVAARLLLCGMPPRRCQATATCKFPAVVPVDADCYASIAQLAERTLRKRTVVGSIPTGGFSPGKAQE